MSESGINRRRLLTGGALLGTAGAAGAMVRHDGMLGGPPETFRGTMPWRPGYADEPPQENGRGYQYFTAAEAAFVEAATAVMIPNDENGPGAIEAGVPYFIDRQLAGPYGHGDRFYLGGPWPKGLPTQGYQSRFTPAELYRAGIRGTEGYVSANFGGKAFKDLAFADQDKVLHALDGGQAQLQSVDGKTFFTMFLQNTMEGYFSDPIYGGNRNLGPWRMIGFPGAHYDYKEWISRHGERFPLPPVGIRGRPGWEA